MPQRFTPPCSAPVPPRPGIRATDSCWKVTIAPAMHDGMAVRHECPRWIDQRSCLARAPNKMVNKSYLRYEPQACFGVVCSSKSNGVWLKAETLKSSRSLSQYAACPALENVIIWDVKRGEQVRTSSVQSGVYVCGVWVELSLVLPDTVRFEFTKSPPSPRRDA